MDDSASAISLSAPGCGARLDSWLADTLDTCSRSEIQTLIAKGRISVDGCVARKAGMLLKTPCLITIDVLPSEEQQQWQAEKIPLSILYEDEEILVLDKPAGMVVHPAPGHIRGTLVNALLFHCGASLSEVGDETRPGIVHRLDKDTSGVMVAAKSRHAHHMLSVQWQAHEVRRRYRALVYNVPSSSEAVIEGSIARHPVARKKMTVAPHGRAARTRYRIDRILAQGRAARLSCFPETGRTHQIRVHLAHHGHPLLGDPLYTQSRRLRALPASVQPLVRNLTRQALHAESLSFLHPKSGRRVTFETPPPSDMQHLEDALS